MTTSNPMRQPDPSKFGAYVSPTSTGPNESGQVCVHQTIGRANDNAKQRIVQLGNDAELLKAIRDALAGNLEAKKSD